MSKRDVEDDHDDDDDDDDEPQPRRRVRLPASRSGLARFVATSAWGLLLIAAPLIGGAFVWLLSHAKSAPQEASIAAIFAVVFIGLYVFVRCVEKVTNEL